MVLLQAGNSQTNVDLLLNIAAQIGIQTQRVESLLAVNPGAVQAFQFGSTDLLCLLALSIVTARENPNHPLRRLATEMPDWLQFIAFLKRSRNPASHGAEIRLTDAFLKDALQRVGRIVGILLPDAPAISAEPPTRQHSASDLEYERRLNARIHLEENIGMQNLKLLGSHVGNLLLNAEMLDATAGESEIEVGHGVGDLYAAMQAVTSKVLADFPLSGGGNQMDKTVEIAEQRAAKAGLILDNASLPRVFATVRTTGIRQALTGLPPTLGASVVAMLVRAPEDWLAAVGASLRDALARLATLTSLRGHGNSSIRMTAAEYRALKLSIYQTIRTITEA